jgi:hypothetical protein
MIIEIIKTRIEEFNKFLDDDWETKKHKIKTTFYNNRYFIFYMTIIAIILAHLSIEYGCSKKKSLVGGNAFTEANDLNFINNIKGNFKSVGQSMYDKITGNYFISKLGFLWYLLVFLVVSGLVLISPFFLYLLVLYIIIKFLIFGAIQF